MGQLGSNTWSHGIYYIWIQIKLSFSWRLTIFFSCGSSQCSDRANFTICLLIFHWSNSSHDWPHTISTKIWILGSVTNTWREKNATYSTVVFFGLRQFNMECGYHCKVGAQWVWNVKFFVSHCLFFFYFQGYVTTPGKFTLYNLCVSI